MPRNRTRFDELSKEFLTPGEVAALFGVGVKTVTRWAQKGRLPAITTPGGHRRYLAADVRRILQGSLNPAPEDSE